MRIRTLLPDSADWIKLKFEAYKYFLLGILAIIATVTPILFPVLRVWVENQLLESVTWLQAEHSLKGIYLGPLLISIAYACYRFIRLCFVLHGPAYTRHFMVAEYDNIKWRWKWIASSVCYNLLKPYCVICDTELHITEQVNPGLTRLYCTMCNKGFIIRGIIDLPDHAKRKIESDARTGRWKQKIKT